MSGIVSSNGGGTHVPADRPREAVSELELLRKLHEHLPRFPECAGVLVSRVKRDEDGHWQFEIPAGVNAPCRSAIIREQAALRLQYDLQDADRTVLVKEGAFAGTAFQSDAFATGPVPDPSSYQQIIETGSAPLSGGGSLAAGADVLRPPRAATIILDSVRRDPVAITLSATTFISLIDLRLDQIKEGLAQKNDPDTIAELDDEFAKLAALKARASEVQVSAIRFKDDPEQQQAAVAASTSFLEGIRNWWTEKHVSICDSAFKTSIFLAGASVSAALGIPIIGASVCGVLVGGEPVAKVLGKALGKSDR